MQNTNQDPRLSGVLASLDATTEAEHKYFKQRSVIIPSRKEIILIIKRIQSLMFPAYFAVDADANLSRDERIAALFETVKRQVSAAYAFSTQPSPVDTESVAYTILEKLPEIKETLLRDVEALYEGDPAARSPEEVILSYPGFYAISIYRIAHEFYKLGVPYVARIMTEFAHEKTGVDIHAGATIGEYFFIDHGTGIVIGETTTIGDHVKIYQGVTLGAKSFELDEEGNPIKGTKRHPDIGNRCVIYANATILGGNTRIGDGTVVGANVWLTHSVGPDPTVYYSEKCK